MTLQSTGIAGAKLGLTTFHSMTAIPFGEKGRQRAEEQSYYSRRATKGCRRVSRSQGLELETKGGYGERGE